jgi:hypothetical protein
LSLKKGKKEKDYKEEGKEIRSNKLYGKQVVKQRSQENFQRTKAVVTGRVLSDGADVVGRCGPTEQMSFPDVADCGVT